MKKIEVLDRDFKQLAPLQPEFKGTQGLAYHDERKIYIDRACEPRTKWGRRVILEHEIAHFIVGDSGLDTSLTPAQDELLADWIGLCRVPDSGLHVNERYFKQWLLRGLRWQRYADRLLILENIIRLLAICPDVPATETAERLAKATR